MDFYAWPQKFSIDQQKLWADTGYSLEDLPRVKDDREREREREKRERERPITESVLSARLDDLRIYLSIYLSLFIIYLSIYLSIPEYNYFACSSVRLSNPTRSKIMYNMSAHRLPLYFQPQRILLTAWTASVMSYTRRKWA